jgi:hypothetical protein
MFTRLTLLVLCFGSSAWAQLDTSSAVLLRPSAANVEPEELDSTRYKIRVPESKRDDGEDAVEDHAPPPPKVKKVVVKSVAPEAPPLAPAPAPPPVQTPTTTLPPVTEQVRELILGGSADSIEEARKQIHPQDPRANVVSLSIAPAYFYEGSGSEYSFHRYNSNGPGFGLGMNLWLTPFFGLQSKYFSSVSASVRSGAVNSVPLEVQTFDAGVRFRKHFGYSRKAAQLSWGFDYHDRHDKISRDATDLVGSKASGLSLVLEGVVPSSVIYAHTFELGILPHMHHSEQSTGINVRSGDKSETNALSLSLGGTWTLDRTNQIFWRGQYSVERDLFEGSADTVDPHSGQTPSGVSVTESLMIFYFGFRWGS